MISARELEFVLYEHPAVWDVAVVKQEQDETAVFVQLRSGQSLDSSELTSFCRTRLGESDTPKHLYVVGSLPKTKTGKIAPHLLLSMIPKLSAC